jgi:hypothetical protein
MEMVKYHQLRTAVQANASPGAGAQLTLLEAALRDRLIASGLFVGVEVEHTDNPDNLVIAMCEFRPELTEKEIASQLEEIWDNQVRYQFWEAHSTYVEDEHVEFEAATRPDSTGRYVTVHLVAKKAFVPAQRQHG